MNHREAQELMDLIGRLRERGTTILLIEHNMNLVMSISDKVVIGDGITRRFGPGDAVLFEDLTGQGHISRSVGGDL